MRIIPNRRRGFAALAWVLVVFFIVFIVIIFGVAYTCIKTIQRICPPPDKDADGTVHMPAIGDKYQGGTVTGYAPPPHAVDQLEAPPADLFTVHWVYIYADNSPRPAAWTNCIWNGPLGSEPDVFTLESWPVGQMPAQRFYNKIISNGF